MPDISKDKNPTPAMVKAYIRSGGSGCPLCGDYGIEGGPVEIDSGYAWQNCTCTSCNFEWQDIYELVSISDLKGTPYPSL